MTLFAAMQRVQTFLRAFERIRKGVVDVVEVVTGQDPRAVDRVLSLLSERGLHFAEATHPFWWLAVGAGVTVVALGAIATSSWGEQTRRSTVALIEAGDAA